MVDIRLPQAMALMDIVGAARIVVTLDGTDRVSIEELREAISAYDASMKADNEA
jgi:hypothetical protein